MSPQVIEVLIFAAIAFFIINKLISILGGDDDNVKYKGSKFGEPSIKDITNSGNISNNFAFHKAVNKNKIDYSTLLDPKDENLKESLDLVGEKISKFDPNKFLSNASKAWKMIITSLKNNDNNLLNDLVDSRFHGELKDKKSSYSEANASILPDMKISDITFFGNRVIIKVIVSITGFDNEEWAFARNVNQDTPNWYLSNIEKFHQ